VNVATDCGYGRRNGCSAGAVTEADIGSVEWFGRISIANSFVSFFRVLQIEPGLNVFSVGETPLSLCFLEILASGVIPSSLHHEFVPDLDLIVGRAVAVAKAPIEDFLIGATLKDPGDDGLVIDPQKARASRVEIGPICGANKIIGRKAACCMKPNLVQHASEENNAANFFITAAETGYFHDGCRLGRLLR
jgi:hypothetical protein